jgi:protein-disulfide isomerase
VISKRIIVLLTGLVAIGLFFGAGLVYEHQMAQLKEKVAAAPAPALIRDHSPIIGIAEAPVTIVEFFDPACEACRAFYPIVKQILARHPSDVRLVLRYAPLHDGSDHVVRMLEAARLQGVFEPVLESLLRAQQSWAMHGNPEIDVAWEAARDAGLNVERAKQEISLPAIEAVLKQDIADLTALKIRATPTFFVNGQPLQSFGPRQLYEAVLNELQRLQNAN